MSEKGSDSYRGTLEVSSVAYFWGTKVRDKLPE
jgi:hypothetical protein